MCRRASSITMERECLDHILVLGERHLEQVLKEYVPHYNKERPHRGLSLRTPEAKLVSRHPGGETVRTSRLGGLINDRSPGSGVNGVDVPVTSNLKGA